MRNPRSINILLKLMLENTHLFSYGLRGWAQNLKFSDLISDDEYIILNNYILANKPIQPTPFVTFWWPRGYLLSREEWLKEHIKLTESIDNKITNVHKLKRIFFCNWLYKLEIIAMILTIIASINMILCQTHLSLEILAHICAISVYIMISHQVTITMLTTLRSAERSNSKEKIEL